jgi:hypothetical protein
MNIFYLSKNVTECAEQHVDKHCVKMMFIINNIMGGYNHDYNLQDNKLIKLKNLCWHDN